MAAAEARALLDQLMGGDRNAALPKGAALPRRRNKRGPPGSDGGSLLLPGKKHKSCYDRDVCPLYCAWNGIDVYELFVNTKSDIGPNPNTPDDAAKDEYQQLPQHEKERLGFEYLLFRKLADLVQQCDRTVQRNQDKLHRELQQRKRQMAQKQAEGSSRGKPVTDYVQDIDEAAVEQVLRNHIMVEDLGRDLEETMAKLYKILDEENLLKERLKKEAEAKSKAKPAAVEEEGIKAEEENETDEKETDGKESQENGTEQEKESTAADDVEPAEKKDEVAVKTEPKMEDDADPSHEGDDKPESESSDKKDEDAENTLNNSKSDDQLGSVSLELGKLTLEKQALVCQLARTLGKLGPLQDAVDQQLRNLCIVKSDITTDKTVCEVSGNFMSARDADERIAAHYAGKQYVGWKLVRDKFSKMLAKHGKYGPPPPQQPQQQQPQLQMRGGPPMPPSSSSSSRGGGGGRSGHDRRSSAGGGRYGGDGYRGGGSSSRDRYGGGRRSPSPQRWERGGGGGGGGGRYDRYDRGPRGGGSSRNGGGGGYGRR